MLLLVFYVNIFFIKNEDQRVTPERGIEQRDVSEVGIKHAGL
jgi:hypothetical protein